MVFNPTQPEITVIPTSIPKKIQAPEPAVSLVLKEVMSNALLKACKLRGRRKRAKKKQNFPINFIMTTKLIS